MIYILYIVIGFPVVIFWFTLSGYAAERLQKFNDSAYEQARANNKPAKAHLGYFIFTGLVIGIIFFSIIYTVISLIT